MHYVDEGEGRPVLLLHGNPTWSFLYRKLIRRLSDDYRCVAPDYLGFGLSEKPRDWSYRPEDHAATVERLIGELDLSDPTLVVHDWGGPIGLSYALGRPENVDSLVVANSFAWPVEDRSTRLFGRVLGSRLGRFLIRRCNVFADDVMRIAVANERALTPVHDHYLGPMADPDDREGSRILARELRGSEAWLRGLWERRGAVAGKPALLCWGMRDPAFGVHDLRRWEALFPDARTVEFGGVGHFVPEEAGDAMAAEVEAFLAGR